MRIGQNLAARSLNFNSTGVERLSRRRVVKGGRTRTLQEAQVRRSTKQTRSRRSTKQPPLISMDDSNGTQRVRRWLGTPEEGAVEHLTIVCAHCNASLKPRQIDYDCHVDKLSDDLRCATQ